MDLLNVYVIEFAGVVRTGSVCLRVKMGEGSITAILYSLLGFTHIKVISLVDNTQIYLNYFIPSLFIFAHYIHAPVCCSATR